jgi:two-component system OmpR family response regulator
MQPIRNASGTTERLKVGGPLRVVLVADPTALVLRMAEVVKALPSLRLAGAFGTAQDAIDWMLWDREGYHLAFVDLGLREGGSDDVVRRLLEQRQAGTVVALGDHLWQEIRQRCAAMGVYHLLEKGDLVAFRSFLQDQAR